jgi:hypothetical protein
VLTEAQSVRRQISEGRCRDIVRAAIELYTAAGVDRGSVGKGAGVDRASVGKEADFCE